MNVYLNNITGIADAITSMYMSKRSWTREKELHIHELCDQFYGTGKLCGIGKLCGFTKDSTKENYSLDREELDGYLSKLFSWGMKHITLLRYIDFSFTVEGLHRGAQDDFDSHAKRLENRIIRSSTRLATFGNEMSDWYKGKIITTDQALETLGISMPNSIDINGIQYMRCVNGYVRSDLSKSKDVLRGLYMLSIPSNFIFKVNLTELAHIVKERDKNSNAHPELQAMIEEVIRLIQCEIPQLDREFYYGVKN